MSVDVIDVAGYAAAVRRALGGLGPEQIEDLTDGLEADLAEAVADEATAGRGADPVARFGTPEEYAAELGVAPQTPPRPFGSTPALVGPSPAPTAQAVPDEATPTSGATAVARPGPDPTAAVPTP